MKKYTGAVILVLLISLLYGEDLKLKNGTVLKDYRIINHSAVDAVVVHEGGAENVELKLLPDELQKKYGYNKEDAEKYRRDLKQKEKEREAQLRVDRQRREAQLRVDRQRREAQRKLQETVSVKSTIIKKVDGKHRYFFDIRNETNAPFSGSVEIKLLYQRNGKTCTADTFSTPNPIQPGNGKFAYLDARTGPPSVHGEYSVGSFSYSVSVNKKVVATGSGKLTNKIEGPSY